jgi:hypothetical protein
MPSRVVRLFVLFAFLAVTAAAQSSTPASQPAAPDITGAWVLNPALTQRPAEIGFSPAWAAGGESSGEGGRSGGGRSRRGGYSSGGGAAGASPRLSESLDDSTRMQQLTDEARTPPTHVTIVRKDTSVSIADDQGHSRTFHPNGQLEDLTIGTVALPTTAHWSNGSLVVVFDIESGRQLRYTYTPSQNPARLLVDIRFLERGQDGDEVKLTYEPPDAHDRAVLSGAPLPSAPSSAPAATTPAVPGEAPLSAAGTRGVALPPGSELRGITSIATDISGLDAASASCGLDETKIKTSIAKMLADGGFKASTYGNEDADLIVNVSTSKLQDGVCVSRYDVSLISHADAIFPYLKGTVPAVEVQLLHDGGMAGGSPAAHATGVTNAIAKSVNSFVSRIRSAGK